MELRSVFKDTGGIDAASILLDLTDYRAITATHEPAERQAPIEPTAAEASCPSSGVLTTRIHARVAHRIKDLTSVGDDLRILVRKRRLVCLESACARRSFVQSIERLPFRGRITTRLSQKLVQEMSREPRAVSHASACELL